MTQIDKAEAHDDDLIRRGDAVKAITQTAVRWGVTGEPAILIATKAAIDALPARGVGVKPLEWNDAAFLEQYAKSVAGTYRVFEKDGLWRATVHTADDAHFVAETEYLHEAKAAAQADYEARILAALAPTDAAQAREAALREAAAIARKMAAQWWAEYKDVTHEKAYSTHHEGMSDGADEVAAAILRALEQEGRP